jgi:hypothetical protein
MPRKRLAVLATVTVMLAGLLTAATWAASTRAWVGGPNTMMGGEYGPGMMDGSGRMVGSSMMGGEVGPGMMGGSGMMGGFGLVGDGRPVDSLDQARQRAQVLADEVDLRVGEVMRFANGFYAELETAAGAPATELLIDRNTGAVSIEYGPAMMWNTDYGMHAGTAPGGTPISTADVGVIAQRWLDARRAGLTAGEAEEFPGYVTLHTMRAGTIVGMMSVNVYTGAVWYHTWHGRYIEMSEG